MHRSRLEMWAAREIHSITKNCVGTQQEDIHRALGKPDGELSKPTSKQAPCYDSFHQRTIHRYLGTHWGPFQMLRLCCM